MKSPKPQNSTTAFFDQLQKDGKTKPVQPAQRSEVEATNARLEKVRRESIKKARRSEISASKIVLNA